MSWTYRTGCSRATRDKTSKQHCSQKQSTFPPSTEHICTDAYAVRPSGVAAKTHDPGTTAGRTGRYAANHGVPHGCIVPCSLHFFFLLSPFLARFDKVKAPGQSSPLPCWHCFHAGISRVDLPSRPCYYVAVASPCRLAVDTLEITAHRLQACVKSDM